MNQQNGKQRRSGGPSPFQFVGLGFEIAGPLLIGVFGGQWLDRRFGTAPWLLLVGAFLGGAAVMLSLYRRIKPPGGNGSGGPA